VASVTNRFMEGKTKANPIMNEAILNRTKKQLAYFLEKLKEKEQVLF